MDEESNPASSTSSSSAAAVAATAASNAIIITGTTKVSINSHNNVIGGAGNDKCGSNNMETKGINIPTDTLPHAESKSSGNTTTNSNGSSINRETTSDAARTTTKEEGTSSITCPPTTTTVEVNRRNSQNSSIITNTGHQQKEQEQWDCNASTVIDPLKESTRSRGCAADYPQDDGTRRSVKGEVSRSADPATTSSSTTATVVTTSKVGSLLCSSTAAADDVGNNNRSKSDCSTIPGTNDSGNVSEESQGASVSNNLYNNIKPPVPNFRVEGSGTGDSSITAAAVASLSSAVAFHSGGGAEKGSTAATNSLENNGEQPGSSGPVSIQSSSEEMRLSLVSWYSEPENPSGLIEGCCSALNTYRQDENGIVIDDVAGHRDTCSSNSIMGVDAISSVTNDSPVCKSESEEKENKTPEPSGNIDKGKGDKDSDTHFKSEFINPNPNMTKTKTDADNANGNHEESQNSQLLISKSGSGEGDSFAKTNTTKVAGDACKASKSGGGGNGSSQKTRPHVQVAEQRQSCGASALVSSTGGHTSRCQQDGGHHRSAKPECPRCSRRSKSGTTTPASAVQARTRTPASRRVVQSSKSSTEIKKPIKSILKHDSSRGSAGSSGSDKQSSMDSLGSSGDIGVTPVHVLRGRLPNTLMTRSDSGTRARFNFSNGVPETPTCAPEDKMVSKLKRIEKYATLRVRKTLKPRPLDLSDSESKQPNDVNGSFHDGKYGGPGGSNEIMSKSMSYLEKSTNKVHISSAQGHQYGESTSASSTLKRQGSLRVKKSVSPWEPSGTRTSALRLQKMQEAKAKNSPYSASASAGGSSGNSGSAHSGSGDSLHYLPHTTNSASGSGGSSGMSSIHLTGTHSAPVARMSASAAAKEKHIGAKIFSKLSSAMGQTASSNQKRIRQERGVQTEAFDLTGLGRVSLSPIPVLDTSAENAEQIRNLERLCNRYRNQFMKIQSEYEKAESRKIELQKQLEEAQHESTEMIEFLQAEKSTLAESLTEIEVEAKKWKDEIDAVKRDYQSRCSSLVRLSEQHKQEALKSQALLNRLEGQSTSAISQFSHQITDGLQCVHQTRQRVAALTESLLKTYKVPPELLASSETNQAMKEADLSCSLLLPLITSLSAAFPMVPMESLATKSNAASSATVTSSTPPSSSSKVSSGTIGSAEADASSLTKKNVDPASTSVSTSSTMTDYSSLLSLNQAILEREAAEKTGLDDIITPFGPPEGSKLDADQLSLKKEITELNAAIAKLLKVVRVIVVHCDRKVSCVASSILQCLKSIEDDKGGNMAEIAQVQKSLEAWSEKGISSGSTSTSGSPPCKPTVTSTTVGDSPPAYVVGNGHARV